MRTLGRNTLKTRQRGGYATPGPARCGPTAVVGENLLHTRDCLVRALPSFVRVVADHDDMQLPGLPSFAASLRRNGISNEKPMADWEDHDNQGVRS